MSRRSLLCAAAAVALTAGLAGCVSNSAATSASSGALTVTSSATDCAVSSHTAPSGAVTFSVANTADQVTEFYVLAADGVSVVGEVENLGPGLTRTLTVQVKPGSYFTVCKPNMAGDGVGKAAFTVTDSGT